MVAEADIPTPRTKDWTIKIGGCHAQSAGLKRLRGQLASLPETLPSGSVADDQPWFCEVQFISAGGGENLMVKEPCPCCGCPCGATPCPSCGCKQDL